MRINENYLGKNKTFGFSPSFDTKIFYQEVIITEPNTRVKLIHMFNKNEEYVYPIEMEGFTQFVEVNWGDDNTTRLTKDELIDSGRYNQGGMVIEHTFKTAGTYMIEIESVEDLVAVDYDYNYDSNIDKSPCDVIKLITKRIGGVLNTYVPPSIDQIVSFENKLDEVSNRCIETKSRISYDDFSLIQNKNTEVRVPSSWCLSVNKFEGEMVQELIFKYDTSNDLSCFFSRWNSEMENSDSDIIIDTHIKNTIYNIFKIKKYRLDLTGFFAHTKGFYNILNGGSIDFLISKYIYDLNDYEEILEDLFISFKFIMWDFYEGKNSSKEWKTFNDDLKYMGLYKLIRKHPSILKGAFGLVQKLAVQKPFNFLMLKSRFDESKINDEYLISDPIGEYSLDLSYMFFCSSFNITPVYDMKSYNIFNMDSTSIKVNYSKMFAGSDMGSTSRDPIKTTIEHDSSELKILSYLPILSLNSCLNGSIKEFKANISSMVYDNNNPLGNLSDIFMFKSYVNIEDTANLFCTFFCDNFTIINNNNFEDTIYDIDLSTMLTNFNKGMLSIMRLEGEGDDNLTHYYIFSNNFLKETVEQTSNVIINEDYSYMFYSNLLITNVSFNSTTINIFLFMDYNLKKNIRHSINYSYLFYNNIFSSWKIDNYTTSTCNIIQSVGDRFLDQISQENKNTFDSKYQGEIITDFMLYNSDFDTKEAVLNSLISKTMYEFTSNGKNELRNKRFYLTEYDNLNSPKIVSAVSMCDNDPNNIIKFTNEFSVSNDIKFRDREEYIYNSSKHKFLAYLYGSNLFGLELNERIFNKNNFTENANLTRAFANNIGLDIKYNLPYNDRMCLELDKYNFTETFAIDEEVGFKSDFENDFKYSELLKWNDIDDNKNVTVKIGAKHAHIFDHMRIFNINNLNIEKHSVDKSFNTLKIENIFKGRVLLDNFVKHIMSYNDNYQEIFNYFINGVTYDFGSYITRTSSKFPTLLMEAVDKYVGADLVLDRIKTDEEEKYFDLDLTPGYVLKISNLGDKTNSYTFSSNDNLEGFFSLPSYQLVSSIYQFVNGVKDYYFKVANNKTITYILECANISLMESLNISYNNADDLWTSLHNYKKFGNLNPEYQFDTIIEVRSYIHQQTRKFQPSFLFTLRDVSTPSSAIFGSSSCGEIENVFDFMFNLYLKDVNYILSNANIFGNVFYVSPYYSYPLYKVIMSKINEVNYFETKTVEIYQNSDIDFNCFSDSLNLLYNKKLMNSKLLLNGGCQDDESSSQKIVRDNDFKYISLFNEFHNLPIMNPNMECICGDGILNFDVLISNTTPLVRTNGLIIDNQYYKFSTENLKLIVGTLYKPFGNQIFKEKNVLNYTINKFKIDNLISLREFDSIKNLYISSNFFDNISCINSHINRIDVIELTNSFNFIHCVNKKLFGNFLTNNVFSSLQNNFINEKDGVDYVSPNSLDDFYHDDLNIHLYIENTAYIQKTLPRPINIYGHNVKKINIKTLTPLNYTSDYVNIDISSMWNENLENGNPSKFGDFSLIKNIGDKKINCLGVSGLFLNTNYDVSYEYANQFNSLFNMGYYNPYTSFNNSIKANEYDQFYMNRFIFNKASSTKLIEDDFKVIYNDKLSYGQIITAFKVNKKCKISYVLNDETIVIESYEKNTVIELDNFNNNFNKLLKSISISNIINDTPDDLLMIDIRSAFRKNLPLLNYEMFKPRIFIKDNADNIFEMMRMKFKRKEEFANDEYWHINISKSELTMNKTNREVTVNRTYQGELLFTDNLYNIKYILDPNYLNNNSLSFSIPQSNDEFILYCMNDTPFSCYNSGGELVSLEGNLGFDILAYLQRDEDNIFDFSAYFMNLANSYKINYIDPNVLDFSNTVLKTTEPFYITFGDFTIENLDFNMFDGLGEYFSGFYNSFNSNTNKIFNIKGRLNNYLNNFKIVNSFNSIIGDKGISSTSPFNRVHLVEINNSFNLKEESINKIIPKGFLNSNIKNSFSILNSFNNTTILYNLRDESINGNKIEIVNVVSSFNNSIIDTLVDWYKLNILNYILNYRYKLLDSSYITAKPSITIRNEIQLWKQSISNSYYNKDEELPLEDNYVQKYIHTN